MPGAPLNGESGPADGTIPPERAQLAQSRLFGVYIHVPFCRVRCGYCDFNTYTAVDLPGVGHGEYSALAGEEIRFASRALEHSGMTPPKVSTVFFGGGTPTLLAASQLAEMLGQIRDVWRMAPNAEVTVEANPDSVDEAYLTELREAGVSRVSFGVQSFTPHVLQTLDRTHRPENVPRVVRAAQAVGLQVSLDLIYGTPGESASDWESTLHHALELAPDHVSAYSLIVEPGTALARRVHRGEILPIDDDAHAEYYELADDLLAQAGFTWYEVSNWARSAQAQSRHNLAYWTGENWWGVGPGAHSHVGGVRWWNVKHPKAYAERIRDKVSPAAGREVLGEAEREMETVMLSIRTRQGLPLDSLRPSQRDRARSAIAEGLVDQEAFSQGTLRLTRQGRLLADGFGVQLLNA